MTLEHPSRLVIRQIVLENFKSYAGTVTIGPFHKSFTSIVGPNGSGKSNVIDAILFVFGFRAQSIRQDKLSALIHRSDHFKNLTRCSVSIHFDVIEDRNGVEQNDPDAMDSDLKPASDLFSSASTPPLQSFVISREVQGSKSTSKYYLDQKNVTKEAIRDKLKSYGVDLDYNRFLILQGEVEMIATMKPKGKDEDDHGLLEYLEEIIGSAVYIDKIKEAKHQLEDLTQARHEKWNRHKQSLKDKTSLQAGRDKALAYLELKNEATLQKKQVQHLLLCDARDTVQAKADNIVKYKQQLAELAAQRQDLKLQLDDISNTRSSSRKEVADCDARITMLLELFTQLEREDVRIREDFKHLNDKIASKMQENKAHLSTSSKLANQIEDGEKTISLNEQKLCSLKQKQIGLEQQVEELKLLHRRAFADVQAKIQQEKRRFDPIEEKIGNLQSQVNIKQLELQTFDDSLRDSQDHAQRLVDSIKKLTEREMQIHTMIDQINTEKSTTMPLNLVPESSLSSLTSDRDKNKQLLLQKRSELHQLKEILRHQQQHPCQDSISAKLLEISNAGQLPGIVFGRLGSLGKIDPVYDVAITSSCGSLRNIVVDTVETAQKCISYLKEHNLGRTTFIILQQLASLQQNLQRAHPQLEVPCKNTSAIIRPTRLFDHIVPSDPRFALAFYSAIRDTLVCEDVDKAIQVANHNGIKRRVVALNGSLIEASGIMSGGGYQIRRGGMDLFHRPSFTSSISSSIQPQSEQQPTFIETTQKLATIESEIKDLEAAIQSQSTELIVLTNTNKQICQEIDAKDIEIERLIIERNTLANTISEAQASLKKVQQKIQNLNTKNQSKTLLQDDLAALLQEKTKLDNLLSEQNERLAQLQREIDQIGGSDLHIKRQTLDETNQKIDKLQTIVTKTFVMIKTNQEKIETLAVKQKNNAVYIEELKSKLSCTEEAIKGITAKGEDLSTEQDDFQTRKTQLERVFKQEIDPLYQKRAAAYKTAQDQDLNAQTSLEAEKKSLQEAHAKLSLREKELSALKYTYLNICEYDTKIDQTYAEKEKRFEDAHQSMAAHARKIRHEELLKSIAALEDQLRGAQLNLQLVYEYDAKCKDLEQKTADLDAATEKRDQAKDDLEVYKKKRLETFISGFNAITIKLKEMYQMITMGGDAELELVDSLDPFSEGVIFSVRPPKKSWKSIQNLSGGERTLSSLSLVFALHHYKPTPIYVMDEIDAALDFKNVSIIANYIKSRTMNRGAQFIIISLRNNMFELADSLVGIYKTDNHTKSVTLAGISSSPSSLN